MHRAMHTYRLSREGRQTTLILMLTAILLGGFALYTLQSTLGFRYLDFGPSVAAMLGRGLGPGELIPSGILLIMIISAPFLLWSLWEEWSTEYTVSPDGLRYSTVRGISLQYPWTAIRAVRRGEDNEAITEVVVDPRAASIRNPVLRWLHRQALGDTVVPIYAGVAERDALVAQIVEHAGLNNAIPAGTPAAPATVAAAEQT